MTFIRVDDLSLEVEFLNGSVTTAHTTAQTTAPHCGDSAGNGSAPLVFLHEGLGSLSHWTYRGINWPLAVCQASGRAGLVYSRQGYGQSTPVQPRRGLLPPDYMHHQAWAVLPALLAATGLRRPVLIGHSDGATIALLHASRHEVAACVAMAPHVVVEAKALEAVAAAKVQFESSHLRERLARHHADVDGAFRQWNDVWLSEAFRSFDIRSACQSITAPLLLIQGDCDEFGTMRQLDDIAQAAPHALQHRIAQCGHWPHREHPARSLQVMVEFLRHAT